MIIGIIGYGVVGGTLGEWFHRNTPHTVRRYDPPRGMTDKLDDCACFFICVPVATDPKTYAQDTSLLSSAIATARAHNPQAPVFIRSTVLPGTNDRYGTISMPEFLTERQAAKDMNELPVLVGTKGLTIARHLFPDKQIMAVSNVEAEIAKYAHNCFGAMKVTYFNLIKEITERTGADYEKVLDASSLTGFILRTHTQVPGPDGQYGYGGKCFPKDLKAFSHYVDLLLRDKTLLLTAIDQDNQYFREEKEVAQAENRKALACAM